MNNDIDELLPKESPVVKLIMDYYLEKGQSEPRRGYLGASSIGHECSRYLWYGFRGLVIPRFSGRMYRLFETGDIEEQRFVDNLRAIGCEVLDLDPATKKQFEVIALGGHFSGHMDGCAKGVPEAPATWHVLEFKTHNAKSFAKLKAEGVKKSKPQHYAQMMIYMGLTRMTRALYLARNKDTDDLHAERVRYDAAAFHQLMNRADVIIRSSNPPERIAERADDWRCKLCDARDICFGVSEMALPLPSKTCKSCVHATPEIDEDETWRRWSCSKLSKNLSDDDMKLACNNHLVIPTLFPFAAATDAGADHIEMTNSECGSVWIHGNGRGQWTTEELLITPRDIIIGKKNLSGELVDRVKKAFGGTVEHVEKVPASLIDKYAPSKCKKLWDGPVSEMAIELTSEGSIGAGSWFPPTAEFKDDKHAAVEYEGQYCAIVYLEHNHSAIWKLLE